MKCLNGFMWNMRTGYAHSIVKAGRFRVWICPVWFFGYEYHLGHFMLFVLPPFGIGWVGRYE